MSIFSKIFPDAHEKYRRQVQPIVNEINSLESKFESFSDEDLRDKTDELKESPEDLDLLLPESFAVVREMSKRVLEQRHYDVQLMAGIALHQGRVVEMRTGEGKTLAATLPAYLNTLKGGSVHVVTVNDYLSRRDTVWMGQIYGALGLSVACLNHKQAFVYNPDYKSEEKDKVRDRLGGFKVVEDFLEPVLRGEAYKADIVYGTNNEFGFDYLRDNMARTPEGKVQRGFDFVILDEVDFILIDEARTPLIISAPDRTPSELYHRFSKIVKKLEKDDYEIDEEKKAVSLTEEGMDKIEGRLGNIYEDGGVDYLHHLEQALRAQAINPGDGKPLFAKDRDYVVRDGEVVIVDEFTGRLMPSRRWSGGLHQAIEAKEGVGVQKESRTRAKITFQNLFRMYNKLSGMTGTALSSAEEFDKVYGLDVVAIPTHREDVREDLPDLIYKNKKVKYKALLDEVEKRHEKGQPLLIGTRSIEKNEIVARLLEKRRLEAAVLNAKNHEKEAEIIAQAGKLGAITVATNMAGRGVDIVLGGNPPEKQEEVLELGGLHVIGTERHESRRVDNQLRGRAGRQGDPGSSQFFLSLEDELMRVFGGERMQSLMETLNFPEDEPIQASMINKSVQSAQEKVEGIHFDARKRVLQYDNVLNKHREAFYKKRDKVLLASEEELKERFGVEGNIKPICLQIMDDYWMQHLEDMDWLKQSVRLRAYANLDPLVEYKKESKGVFDGMMQEIERSVRRAVSSGDDITSRVARQILNIDNDENE